MKTFLRLACILVCGFAPSSATFAGAAPASVTPASLEVPANQTLALTLTARGEQIYECRAVVGEPTRFEWAFKAPNADLYDAQGTWVGAHYAGPTWD